MKDTTRYLILANVGHIHFKRMEKALEKQKKSLKNPKRFSKYGKKFIYHMIEFDKTCAILDKLKVSIEKEKTIKDGA